MGTVDKPINASEGRLRQTPGFGLRQLTLRNTDLGLRFGHIGARGPGALQAPLERPPLALGGSGGHHGPYAEEQHEATLPELIPPHFSLPHALRHCFPPSCYCVGLMTPAILAGAVAVRSTLTRRPDPGPACMAAAGPAGRQNGRPAASGANRFRLRVSSCPV